MGYIKHVIWVIPLLMLAASWAMVVDEAHYSVLLTKKPFEIRGYDAHILAEIDIAADFDSAGNIAFGSLFSYISGNNHPSKNTDNAIPVPQGEAKGEEINMTLPVGQTKAGKSWLVNFTMPASYSMDTLPEPKDSKVVLREVPARQMAAIRYSGFWSEKGYKRNLEKLEVWIRDKNLRVSGAPIWARYNLPFMPWFLRRNEILIPVAGFESG